ncbi:HTH-type transcriptional repressor KstR2 [Frondihabitans sp. 762G35]|uniref:TetR family transcriptional regulator C-terminal domain-containing protein n=1 Tax=Frondihabitans sp. 762G35 TaxID=1446794 RepID=UPI000D219322|nr:TetR family transcriptional regulator C-terminal domain-containing protein [Frondihabitans sp. 762G35]ARC57838.1 HTH-type transcriptional repressor KstR2 [Frondihabitans sp. 762G35]
MSTERPRAARKAPAERRTEIGLAARNLALDEGLGALTLRGVAARVGVASGLVAHYEPSMEVLVARTFSELVHAEFDDVRAAVGESASPTSRLTALVATLLDGTRDDVSSLWADAWSLGRSLPLLAAAAREHMDEWHAFAAGILRDGVARGEFRAPEPDVVALQLFALVDSTAAYSLVDYRTGRERTHLVRQSLESSLALPPGRLTP